MGCLSKLGQYPSTGPPTYQIIKVPNANHMNVMKTSLTIIPNVSLGSPLPLLEFVQAYPLLHKGLGHLAALYLLYLLFLVTIYLITKLSITYYFSACRENLTENRLSFPSAPRWATLLLIERTMIDPLHLWVIKTLFWGRCRGA